MQKVNTSWWQWSNNKREQIELEEKLLCSCCGQGRIECNYWPINGLISKQLTFASRLQLDLLSSEGNEVVACVNV